MLRGVLKGFTNGSPEHRAQLHKAAAWVRREMKKQWDGYSHPSHLAGKLLDEADKKFDLGSFGVEGHSSATGRSGVLYLNYGDPYDLTIVVRSQPHTYSVGVGHWASYA